MARAHRPLTSRPNTRLQPFRFPTIKHQLRQTCLTEESIHELLGHSPSHTAAHWYQRPYDKNQRDGHSNIKQSLQQASPLIEPWLNHQEEHDRKRNTGKTQECTTKFETIELSVKGDESDAEAHAEIGDHGEQVVCDLTD